MPVVIQYVVERDGEAKMTFASKQQADAYDKMLDLAEMMQEIIGRSELISETQAEALSLFLAQQKDDLLLALQGKSKTAKKSKDEDLAGDVAAMGEINIVQTNSAQGSGIAELASAA